MLVLNARGLKNEQIAQKLNWAIKTVSQTIGRGKTKGVKLAWG